MIELGGRYATGKVFTSEEEVEEKSEGQMFDLMNQEWMEGNKVRWMRDYHYGAGCVIGTTIKLSTNKVSPNIVGVDLNCGMLVTEFGMPDLDLNELDHQVKRSVPTGFNTRNRVHEYAAEIKFDKLHFSGFDMDRTLKSVGSLGSGNHFIEVSENESGNYVLVIHSGSRKFGFDIAKYYQGLASSSIYDVGREIIEKIEELKSAGRYKEIEVETKKIRDSRPPEFNSDLAHIEGEDFLNYLNDVDIAAQFADMSRKAMAEEILRGIGGEVADQWSSVHNYIDTENMIVRKGATSAKLGERLIIPLNMRDGSIIARGKGNGDYNYSAPHGAGRLMSRGQARKEIKLDAFEASMEGIHTTSVVEATLDEAPMAYKRMEDIIDDIQDTVEIVEIIKPIYNFKDTTGKRSWRKKK